MININGIEFTTNQYVGIGVLNVLIPERGELKAHSTDWILRHNQNVIVVTDAVFQELVKGEISQDAETFLPNSVDAPSPISPTHNLKTPGSKVDVRDDAPTDLELKKREAEVVKERQRQLSEREVNFKKEVEQTDPALLKEASLREIADKKKVEEVKPGAHKNETNDEMMARLMGSGSQPTKTIPGSLAGQGPEEIKTLEVKSEDTKTEEVKIQEVKK